MIKVVFVSNFLSSHQEPFCDAMYNNPDVEFTFVSRTPLSKNRRSMGWEEINIKPYEIREYYDREQRTKAENLVENCDVLLMSFGKNMRYMDIWAKKSKGVAFVLSERIYKNGRWRILSPRGLYNRWKSCIRYASEPIYLLCCSAYAAFDYAMLGSYIGKSYKWGYFPPFIECDKQSLICKKDSTEILWAARMIDLKHPELVVELADYLKNKNIKFHITMLGGGSLYEDICRAVKDKQLEEYIALPGYTSPEQVSERMENSAIFIATSDKGEGWGAVINEAMSCGCALAVSESMGAVPYLIKDGVNGFTYKQGRNEKFFNDVERLLTDNDLREKLSMSAYDTIRDLWNADIAAKRLVELAYCLTKKDKNKFPFEEGPCSKAEWR